MTEARLRAELDAALATARRWQALAEARAADCDKYRTIIDSYERDVRKLHARIDAVIEGSTVTT